MPNKKPPGKLGKGCHRLAGLAVVALALAVELAVELAVALGTRSLVVVGVVVKTLLSVGVDSVDAVAHVANVDAVAHAANIGWTHFDCLIPRQRLEPTRESTLRQNRHRFFC